MHLVLWIGVATSLAAAAPANDLPALLEQLNSADVEAKIEAIDTLGLRGAAVAAAALPRLSATLKDPAPNVRAHAVKALGRLGEPAALPALIEALGDGEAVVRREAVQAVYRLAPSPQQSLPVLAKVLADPDLSVRVRVLNVLTDLGRPAVPLLIQELTKPGMGYWAAMALGEIGGDAAAAVPMLAEATRNESTDVRREAIMALAAIGPAAATAGPSLATLVDDPVLGIAATYAVAMIGSLPAEAEAKLRANVQASDELLATLSVWALARLHRGDKEVARLATERLIASLQSSDQNVQSAAARALSDLEPDPDLALPLMEKLLQGPQPTVYSGAVETLGRMGAKGVPHLVAALKFEPLRARAVAVLGSMGAVAEPAVPALIVLLGDTDHRLHDSVLFALAQIGPAAKDAVPSLIKLLEEKNEDVATMYAAAYTLGRIGPAAAEGKTVLGELLKSPDESLALVAFWALAKIDPACGEKTPDTPAALVEQLANPDTAARLRAAAALRCLGAEGKSAVPALQAALGDQNQLVRDMAAEALTIIGQP